MKRGFDVLRDKTLNRSITFSRRDRDRLGLRGLLPHRVSTDRQMVQRVMDNLQRLPRDIDRYMLLSSLQERNERLFYQIIDAHVDTRRPQLLREPRQEGHCIRRQIRAPAGKRGRLRQGDHESALVLHELDGDIADRECRCQHLSERRRRREWKRNRSRRQR